MTKLRPPGPGFKYNGRNVPLEGIEILDRDVEALKSTGWTEVRPKKRAERKEGED